MFHFCIADSEHDWREGTEQYKFIEKCLASADRQKQPWLIFSAHRVLGYSSNSWYGLEGAFEEPMGRESLQKLWQKYRVDIAFFGHVHNYERTCPIYQVCSFAVHVWFYSLQRSEYTHQFWPDSNPSDLDSTVEGMEPECGNIFIRKLHLLNIIVNLWWNIKSSTVKLHFEI